MPMMSFFSLIVQCHILYASMEVLGMADLDDTPNEELIPKDVHTLSKADRADLLSSIVSVILDTRVDISHSVKCEGVEGADVNVVDTPNNPSTDKANLFKRGFITGVTIQGVWRCYTGRRWTKSIEMLEVLAIDI